jgi:hypothetical protein
MVNAPSWWANVSPATRDWVVEHSRERISWHVLPELQRAGATLVQPDRSRSIFFLTDADSSWLGERPRDA